MLMVAARTVLKARNVLLGFLLVIFFFDTAVAEPRLALVIGNSQYTFAPKLNNPENDAKLIGNKLGKVGFDVTTLVNLDYQSMHRALVEFTEKVRLAGPTAVALIYYSGHGMQLREQNYLIPVAAKLQREIDADVEGIPLNGILAYLENVDPHIMIIILDACRDNPLKGVKSLGSRGLARISTRRGSYIAYAAEPGSTAQDGSGEDSPFALALSRYIDQPGLTIDQVFTKVRIDVNSDTDGNQSPRTDSGLLDDFYFIPPAGGPTELSSDKVTKKDVQPKPDEPPPPPSICEGNADPDLLLQKANETGTAEAYAELLRLCPNHPSKAKIVQARDLAAEGAMWKVAQQQNTVDGYRKFLLFYPSGIYASDANIGLQRLLGAPEAAAWEKAHTVDTIQAYRDYLSQFKDGGHAGEAQARIASLEAPVVQPAPQPTPTPAPAPPPAPSPPVRSVTSYMGYDLYGGDIRSFATMTYSDCSEQCVSDNQCIGFTWNSKRGICILKSRWDRAYTNNEAESGMIEAEASGQPHPAAANSFVRIYNNTDFFGGDYDNVKSVTLESCRQMCTGDSGCRAFSYIVSLRWCWLKSGGVVARPKMNVVGGLKQ